MANARFSYTLKASGLQSRIGNNGFTGFFYGDFDDAEALAAAAVFGGLNNGEVVSVSKQILAPTGFGPYPSATANGGSDRARLLFRNDDGHTFQMTLPLMKQSISKSAIEAALEPLILALNNQDGEPIGQLVNIRSSEIVDG